MRKRTILLFGLVSLVAVPALADRQPAPEEASNIANVLISDGYDNWGSIQQDRNGWRVVNARTQDGRVYDLELNSHGYGVVKRNAL